MERYSLGGVSLRGSRILLRLEVMDDRLRNGIEERDDADDQQHARDGAGEERGPVSAGLGHGSAEVGFHGTAQQQAQQDGRNGIVGLGEQIAQHAQHQRTLDIKGVAADGEGTDAAQRQHAGRQGAGGDLQHLQEQPDAHHTEDAHKDVGHDHQHIDAVDGVHMVHEQHGAGGDALEHQRAQQDSRHRIARDAQCQQGHQRAAGNGVVGGLGGDNTVDVALAEAVGILGVAARLVIAHPGGRAAAGGGDDAHDGADDRGAQQVHGMLLDEAEQAQVLAGVGLHGAFLLVAALLHLLEDLGDGEQAHQRGDGLDTGHHVGVAHGEAGGAGDGIHTDGRQHQAQQRGDNALTQVLAGQGGDHAHTEDTHGEILLRAELQRHGGHNAGQQDQDDAAEQAAQRGAQRGGGQGLLGLALLCQGVAVQHRGGCRRRTGGTDQDGGDAAAVDAAAVHAQQQRHGVHDAHVKGEGHQQGHAHGSGQAGQEAEHDTGSRAQQAQREHGPAHRSKNTHLCSSLDKERGDGDLQGILEDHVQERGEAHRHGDQQELVLFAQQQHGHHHQGDGADDEADVLHHEGVDQQGHDLQHHHQRAAVGLGVLRLRGLTLAGREDLADENPDIQGDEYVENELGDRRAGAPGRAVADARAPHFVAQGQPCRTENGQEQADEHIQTAIFFHTLLQSCAAQ